MERLWWHDAVIYHVYPRSFLDTDGDGVGDLPGVRRRLPYLARLGVDALWLSPFFASPMADFGYDVSDHTAVDPLFGSLADFDELLDAAHGNGLRVLIDYVPNHTSDRHRWFRDARADPAGPRRDWYVWRDPSPGGGPPNNWITLFGDSAWTREEAGGQYYLHSFLPSMPDLNWRNPAVQEAMFDVARFWLDRGVDGFRVDCAPLIAKDPLLRDNPPAATGTSAHHRDLGGFDSQLHLHDQGHPDLHPRYRDLRALLDSYGEPGERIALGEVHEYDWPAWSRYFGRDLDELNLPINFGLLGTDWHPEAIRTTVRAILDAVPAGAVVTWVMGSHDDPRVASRVGPAQAANAMLLLLTLPGTAILYNGDELGMPDAAVPPERIRDPWGLRTPALSRDHARSPMPWSPDSPSCGFTFTGVEPWLPLTTPPGGTVRDQEADPSSLLSLTRDLLALRRASAALHGAGLAFLDSPPGVLAYTRSPGPGSPPGAGGDLLVTLNLTDQAVPLDHLLPPRPSGGPWRRVFTTARTRDAAHTGQGALAPAEGAVWSAGDGGGPHRT
ncbi:alpha-amylase family glycosyl hydrolase [Kitasatospora sp. NPDC001539]|uniref:alpha-amylase family glycosyl hydrolase n=1 Tax=Kitasatospora sp. NPDC001539 TaxID=3154384 RepID=UPI00331FB13F